MLAFSAANFSEGRRKPVIDALVAAVAANPDVRVLDVHSDVDHNRSVLSCAGPPQALGGQSVCGNSLCCATH